MKFPKWLPIFVALQVVMFGVLLFYIIKNNKVDYQVVNGPKGDRGDTAQVDYEQINNYIEQQIARIPVRNGSDGQNATPEQVRFAVNEYLTLNPVKNGTNGQNGTNGSDGNHGQDGKSVILRCRDFNSRKSEVQFKYENDDIWRTLYELPHKCTGVERG